MSSQKIIGLLHFLKFLGPSEKNYNLQSLMITLYYLWLLSIWIISSWMCLISLRFSICLSESWYDCRKEADIEFTTNTFMDPILQKNMGLYLESMRKKSKKWPRSKIVSKFWCSAKHIDKNRQISWFELTIFAEWRGQTNYSKYHEFSVCLEPLPNQS